MSNSTAAQLFYLVRGWERHGNSCILQTQLHYKFTVHSQLQLQMRSHNLPGKACEAPPGVFFGEATLEPQEPEHTDHCFVRFLGS